MATGWDFDEKTTGGTSDIEFTKFPEGLTKLRLIDPAPHQRWIHWMNQVQRSVNCPGRGCPICDIRKRERQNKQPMTYSMQQKLSMNVLNRDTKNLEIMEQGVTVFKDIKMFMDELAEEGKTLLDVDIKFRRRGLGKDDTTYRVDIGDTYELTDDDKIKMADKRDLEEYYKPATPEQILRLIDGEKYEDVFAQNAETTATAGVPDTQTTEESDEDIEIN